MIVETIYSKSSLSLCFVVKMKLLFFWKDKLFKDSLYNKSMNKEVSLFKKKLVVYEFRNCEGVRNGKELSVHRNRGLHIPLDVNPIHDHTLECRTTLN